MFIEQSLNPLKMVLKNKKPATNNKMYKWELLTTFNTFSPHREAGLGCSN